MTIRKLLIATALASAAAFVVTPAFAAPAPPPSNADEDCDDYLGELKEISDDLLQTRSSAKTPVAVCAALGQLLGVAKASKALANECYDDEKKRQDIVAALEKTEADLEGQVGNSCK